MNKHKKYIIIEIPSGKILELNTKHKDFLRLLADAKKFLERTDLRKSTENQG